MRHWRLIMAVPVIAFLLFLTRFIFPDNFSRPTFKSPINLTQELNDLQNFPATDSKHVISSRPYGGLGDRFRNVVFSFTLSILFERKYSMSENFLGDSGALAPRFHFLDWTNPNESLALGEDQSFNFVDLDIHRNIILKLNLSDLEKKPVWKVYTNIAKITKELIIHPQSIEKRRHSFISNLFSRGLLYHFTLQSLLQPSTKMAELIEKVWKNETNSQKDKYFKIGIQIRNGDNSEIIDEVPSSTRRRKRYDRFVGDHYLRCFFHKALAVLKKEQGNKTPLIFVTADREDINKQFEVWFRELNISTFDTKNYAGRIKHVAKTQGDQTRAFLDWFLLSQMDHLLISQSGFSESAAKYNCNPVSFFYNVPIIHEEMDKAHGFDDENNCLSHFIEFPHPGLCRADLDIGTIQEFIQDNWPPS